MFRKAFGLFVVLCVMCTSLVGCALQKKAPDAKCVPFTIEATDKVYTVTALNEQWNVRTFSVSHDGCQFNFTHGSPNLYVKYPYGDFQKTLTIDILSGYYDDLVKTGFCLNQWSIIDGTKTKKHLTYDIVDIKTDETKYVDASMKYLLNISYKIDPEVYPDAYEKEKNVMNNPKVWTYLVGYDETVGVPENYQGYVVFLKRAGETDKTAQLAVAYVHKSKLTKIFKKS